MEKEPSIRIIPRAKQKTPGWLNFLVGLSVFLAVAAAGVFLFLYYEESNLKQTNIELDNQIAALQNSDFRKLELKLAGASEIINDFSKIFKDHKIVSGLFFFLKSFCHPFVQFTSMNFTSEEYNVGLDARTKNFKTLGEQLLGLKVAKDKIVKNLQLSNVSLDEEGEVGFQLNFNLEKSFFTR